MQTDEEVIPDPQIVDLGRRAEHERARRGGELYLALVRLHARHGRHEGGLRWCASPGWWCVTQRGGGRVGKGQLGVRWEDGANDEPQAQREHRTQLHR
jgi:hypothetical protein